MSRELWWGRALLKLHYVTEADYCAAAAYRTALEIAETPQLRERFEEFRCDHSRHIRDLRKVTREEGGCLKLPYKKAQYFQDERERLATSESDDEITRCLQTMTEFTSSFYEEVLEYDLPGPIPVVLKNGLTDVLRHRAWLKDVLALEAQPGIFGALPLPEFLR